MSAWLRHTAAACAAAVAVVTAGCSRPAPAVSNGPAAAAAVAGAPPPGKAEPAASGQSSSPPAAPPSQPSPWASATNAGPQRRALLIGVTEFTNKNLSLPALEGPANDVELFSRVLVDSLGVPEEQIHALAGLPQDSAGQPTRANVEAAFHQLAAAAQSGDEIVVFMAGHGSQQPADPDPADDEPDGFDEIFLPADIGGWDGARKAVANAIVDDDLRGWLTEIRSHGAAVWVVIDSCFSGTMTRGGVNPVEREREVPMSRLVPRAEIDAAAARTGRTSRRTKQVLGLGASAGDLTAMYATDINEKTAEAKYGGPDTPVHGLFTYTLAEVLKQTSSPITYRELAGRVLDRYRARQRFASTPTFEGGGLDHQILSQKILPNRPQMLLTARDGNAWTLDAGTLRGLSVGSVLEVFPPAGAPRQEQSVGFVRVVASQPLTARVQPAPYSGRHPPAAATLIERSRARVAFYQGSSRLRVAFERANRRGDYAIVGAGAGPQAIDAGLASLSDLTNGLAERVSGAPAEWFVRIEGGMVTLRPAGGWAADATPVMNCKVPTRDDEVPAVNGEPIHGLQVGSVGDPDLANQLAAAFRKIGRAANLAALSTNAGSGPRLDFVVSHGQSESGPFGPMSPGTEGATAKAAVTIHAGDWLEYRMSNRGDTAIDVTLLYVDAAFGLSPLFPDGESQADNRIAAGDSRTVRVQVSGCPLGWESTVAIAVEAADAAGAIHQEFLELAQPGIVATRGGSARSVVSPLRQLLRDAAFGRRGAPAPEGALEHFALRMASWRTEPAR